MAFAAPDRLLLILNAGVGSCCTAGGLPPPEIDEELPLPHPLQETVGVRSVPLVRPARLKLALTWAG